MKISLQVGKHSIPLSAEALESLVMRIPDVEENQALFAELAGHPASAVRREVAQMNSLSAVAVQQLAADVYPDVRRNLLRTAAGRAFLTEALLRQIADSNIDCAEIIAGEAAEFQLAPEALVEHLGGHSDPRVRLAAARSFTTPKKLLKKLAKDEDTAVRNEALSSLRSAE